MQRLNGLHLGYDAEGAVAARANLDGAGLGVYGDRLHSQGSQSRIVEIGPGVAAVGAVEECCQAGAESQGFARNVQVVFTRTTDRDGARVESAVVEGEDLCPVRPLIVAAPEALPDEACVNALRAVWIRRHADKCGGTIALEGESKPPAARL